MQNPRRLATNLSLFEWRYRIRASGRLASLRVSVPDSRLSEGFLDPKSKPKTCSNSGSFAAGQSGCGG